MDTKKLPYDELEKQCTFYRNRMEAAESKISLLMRGFKLEPEVEKTDD